MSEFLLTLPFPKDHESHRDREGRKKNNGCCWVQKKKEGTGGREPMTLLILQGDGGQRKKADLGKKGRGGERRSDSSRKGLLPPRSGVKGRE